MRNRKLSNETLCGDDTVEKKIEELKKMPLNAKSPSFKFSAETGNEEKKEDEKKEKEKTSCCILRLFFS